MTKPLAAPLSQPEVWRLVSSNEMQRPIIGRVRCASCKSEGNPYPFHKATCKDTGWYETTELAEVAAPLGLRQEIIKLEEELAQLKAVPIREGELPPRPETIDVPRGNGNDVDGYWADEVDAYIAALESRIKSRDAELSRLRSQDGEGERFQRPRLHVNAATGESTYLVDEANNLFDRMEQRERELQAEVSHRKQQYSAYRQEAAAEYERYEARLRSQERPR